MFEIALVGCCVVLAQKISRAVPNLTSRFTHLGNLSELPNVSDDKKFDLLVVQHVHAVVDENAQAGFERYLPKTTPAIAIITDVYLETAAQLLNVGIDRCLPASFDESHFGAVVRALTRRSHGLITSVSQYGVLSFNHETKQAWIHDLPVELTKREAQVLETLLKRVGQIIAKEDFIQAMDPDTLDINESAVEVYVHRLRKKISNAYLPIQNIKRCGYFLRRYDLQQEVWMSQDFQPC